jgi:zinc transport system substrate-binding protein
VRDFIFSDNIEAMVFSRITKKDILIFSAVFLTLGAIFIFHKPSAFVGDNYSVVENSNIPKLQIATSFPLAADWINSVGKDRVQVSVFASPTDDGLTQWLKKPSSDAAQETKVFVSMGNNFDQWAKELSGGDPKIKIDVMVLSDFATSTNIYANLSGPSENSQNSSPYYWLSLRNAREAVQGIARELGRVDAANREYYINNAYEYSVELDSLLHETTDVMGGIKNERVAIDGIKWAPLVDSLQVRVIGVIDSQSVGNNPKAAINLKTVLNKNKITTVVTDADSYGRFLEKILSGTTTLAATIDPWGLNSNDYIDFMRANISELMRAL